MAQFYKYIVTIVNQIPQESYICYTKNIAYHLVHVLDSHQISNILKLIWLSCLFKFSPSMLMLPCSILRHVWVPKKAKYKVLDNLHRLRAKDTRVFLDLFSTGEFFMAKGKNNSNPCQLLAFETPPGAFSRFNLSNGKNPTGPKKRNAMFFFRACWRRSIAYPCPRGRIEVPNP